MPRMYEPIWKELKLKGAIKVDAPKAAHKRIIKAVIKEKFQDVGWHLQMSEAGRRYTLAHTTDHEIGVITFTLRDTSKPNLNIL